MSPRIYVTPRHFARPYYTFRPRFSVAFGLFIGQPVPYPYQYRYAYPIPYPDPYAYPNPGYGYPPNYGPVGVAPGVAVYGGVSFDISPGDAAVYVDGEYVGTAYDFAPTEQPLSLTPGLHRIEVEAPGYQMWVFDANVISGQVIPYQGTLQPLRPY